MAEFCFNLGISLAIVWVFCNTGARKVGGIWFFRLGRIRVSYCIARKRAEV